MYIELHTASAFSFLEAASLPEALVDQAARFGYPAIALLDRDGVYGAPRFHRAASAAGIKALIGAELTLNPTNPTNSTNPRTHEPTNLLRLPVLVESAEGYRNLCRLVTRMKMRAPKGEGALALDELDGQTRGLVALAGRELLGFDDVTASAASSIRSSGCSGATMCMWSCSAISCATKRPTTARWSISPAAFHVPLVATNGVRFAEPRERPLFDVLTCIRHKTNLAQAGRKLARNAERYLKPPEEMARLFRDLARGGDVDRGAGRTAANTRWPISAIAFPTIPCRRARRTPRFSASSPTWARASATGRITTAPARRSRASSISSSGSISPATSSSSGTSSISAGSNDILVQGRGSAANSAVCYSLGITAVDPVGMDLLFERFLSEERGEWPDIDLDLPSGDRRERVIQHVYEKYGRLGAAMTANVITYRGRSAAREVGKVLGIDTGAGRSAGEGHEPVRVRRSGRHAADAAWSMPAASSIIRRSDCSPSSGTRMQDLPRHLGQHSGGMVICQGRLDSVVPLENASMPGRVVRAVGQGRLRRHGHRQSGSARPRHDGRAAGRHRL